MKQQSTIAPTGLTAIANRYAWLVKIVSIVCIFAALIILARSVSIDDLTRAVAGMGIWGPVAYGVAYALATVLMIPGSLLTLAAGPLFGLGLGFITVSLGSTAGAALAFLVARYLARARIQQQAQRYPKFQAIDTAIGRRGWKIIGLLRLSPAVPFALSNYFYGLTSIPFGPYVLTSWIAMMPGTLMYVYLGYAGGAAAGAAAGADHSKTPGEWILLGVGLAATVLVTVYVTRVARKAIREQTDIEPTASDTENGPMPNEKVEPVLNTTEVEQRWPWGATMLLLVAVVSLTGVASRGALRGLFGPPRVTLHEAYTEKSDGAKFDHASFDQLLHKHVDADGWVDYAGLAADAGKLDAYIATLAKAPLAKMGRSQRLALLINAYNACTLRLILDHWDGGTLTSITAIPPADRWDARRWKIGGNIWSLNDIEQTRIRPNFKEPRIHFALVCAAVGCPKLRDEAYRADRLDQQLADQARYVHTHDRWFRFDAAKNVAHLSRLYDWYGGDFEQVAGSVLTFAARYSPKLTAAMKTDRPPTIAWLVYDWKLNDKRNKP